MTTIAADVARIVAERVARAQRPTPCYCARLGFPHRHEARRCDNSARPVSRDERDATPDRSDWTINDYRREQRDEGPL